ncbi:MAG: FAD-dependent oxidoreductase [Planctomycetota bacterium]|nr:FAD-dependent oxidoreductase [Planctomycetota bacterium]MDI6788446.1 FAD-dependent oxidoreductase [Planctomycetota bacterium]
MSRTSDAVVIGAGVMGCSIAYQLARRGLKVTVVEKGPAVACGSTGKSSAIIRQHYSNPETITMAYQGLQFFGHWQDFTGLKENRCGFKKTGCLMLFPSKDQTVESCLDLMKKIGVRVLALPLEVLKKEFPSFNFHRTRIDPDKLTHYAEVERLKLDELESASFEEESGYADPQGTTLDLMSAAQEHKAELLLNHQVIEIGQVNNQVKYIKTHRGETISTPVVVNAAGVWATEVNKLARVYLPLTIVPTRHQIVFRNWPTGTPSGRPETLHPVPVCGDLVNEIYFRPEGSGQILVGSLAAEDDRDYIENPDNYTEFADENFYRRKLIFLHNRIPMLESHPPGERISTAGLYDVTLLDWHPILDKTEVEGFYVAVGLSGHGFKLAPVMGIMMAKLITGITCPDQDTGVDISFFRANRPPIRANLAQGVIC